MNTITSVLAELFFVVIFIFSLFYLYIRNRYDEIMESKVIDIIKEKDNMFTIIFGIVIFALFVLLLVIRNYAEKTTKMYFLILAIITVAIMAIEASVFIYFAPRTI